MLNGILVADGGDLCAERGGATLTPMHSVGAFEKPHLDKTMETEKLVCRNIPLS